MKIMDNFNKVSSWIDSIGGESRGITRLLPNEREQSLFWVSLKVAGLWISGCGGLTSMSSYFLGPLIYGLGYKDTILIGCLGTILGCLFPAYLCLMGPFSGLRQMASSRYLFGEQGVRFVALVTIVGFIGWSVTNSVLGGQILQSVSNGSVPIDIGILLVNLLSLVVTIFGINYVLKFETIIGFLVITVVFLMYIIAGDQIVLYHDLATTGDDYRTKLGDRLSYFVLCFSVVSTWGGCASDYYVLFPEKTSKLFLSLFTFFGVLLPTLFGALIGMLIGNATVGNAEWYEQYTNGSVGGLLRYIFHSKWGRFGDFLMVILWLSLITNNIINTYSSSLSVLLLDPFFHKYVPRWFISIILFVIVLICSLVGKDKFSVILSNFLPMLGYWIAIYFTLLLEENLLFRSTRLINLFKLEFKNGIEEDGYYDGCKGNVNDYNEASLQEKDANVHVNTGTGISPSSSSSFSMENTSIYDYLQSIKHPKPYYNFNKWDTFSHMTLGIAAAIAFCFGVAGAVLGMAQVYYIGVIAATIGEYGGDVGMWLAMAFTGVSYPVLRYIELKIFNR